MKKRILALVLVALMTVPFLACGADNATPTVTTDPAATTEAPATDPAVTTEPELTPDLPEIRFDEDDNDD